MSEPGFMELKNMQDYLSESGFSGLKDLQNYTSRGLKL
jgi:hypothetical protein